MDLRGILKRIEDAGAEPVVLRNWEGLPDRAQGDVDLLVRESSMPSVATFLVAEGFDHHVSRGDDLVAGARAHVKFRRDDGLFLDVVERLCYRSPFFRRRPWVAVDPQLTAWMFERRRPHESGAFHVPGAPDAFGHLLCHAVFDKRAFPAPYPERLSMLARALDDLALEPVLSRLFFKVWNQVLELVRTERFDALLHLEKLKGY